MAIKIALAGNPNCGKTTLFNDLTGSSQYVVQSLTRFRLGLLDPVSESQYLYGCRRLKTSTV